jgi:hypothetical protein
MKTPDSDEVWQFTYSSSGGKNNGYFCIWSFEGQNRIDVARDDFHYLIELGCNQKTASTVIGAFLTASYAKHGGPVLFAPAVLPSYSYIPEVFGLPGENDETKVIATCEANLRKSIALDSVDDIVSAVSGPAIILYLIHFAMLSTAILPLQRADDEDKSWRVDITLKTITFELFDVTEAAGLTIAPIEQSDVAPPRLYGHFMFQTDTVEYFKMEPDDLIYFFPGRRFGGWYGKPDDWSTIRLDNDIDLDLMIQTVQRFDRRYTTVGRFKLPFPKDIPLTQFGFSGLKLSAHPHGIWFQPLEADKSFHPVFWWEPGKPFTDMRLASEYLPMDLTRLFDLALSCLWRDMNAENQSVVEIERKSAKTPKKRAKKHRNGKHQPYVRQFPRSPYASGRVRQWSNPAERRRIRRAYRAGGRPRRMPKGLDGHANPELLALADEHGIIVPPGYTYVRPHVRGSRGGADAEPVVIRSRGLATLVTIKVDGTKGATDG